MTHVDALDAGNITKIGIGVIIALVVIGIVLSLIITAIVGRIIIAVVVIGLGIWVWQQRTSIEDSLNKHKCDLSASFFGFHVNAPQDVKHYCKTHAHT
jgi:hypothetical protein